MNIEAHAKVNFTLEVLGERSDGYHDLRSVVVPISLADGVVLEPADGLTLVVDWYGGRGATALPWRSRGTRDPTGVTRDPTGVTRDPTGVTRDPAGVTRDPIGGTDDNLAVRAAKLLQRVSGRKDGVAITLGKRIPVGGGLGGGSADAAAVLNGLIEMWNLGIPRNELAALGAEIGSDVPALVLGGVVLMEGRGERVTGFFAPGASCSASGAELKHDDLRESNAPSTFHLVLANPGVFCSTPKIFQAFDAPLPKRPEILYNMRLAMQSGDGVAVARALQNDLAATAMRLHPEIGAARRRLEEAGCLGASMSGSGATVFGIARDAAEAGRIARELQAEGLWSVAAETVR